MPELARQNVTTQATPIPRATPEEFIAQLPSALRAENGVDTDLTTVLETHIITATPNTDAALAAIIALAEVRATPLAAPPEAQEEQDVFA